MTTTFAAIDNGNLTGAVYGIGTTEAAALNDARRQTRDANAEFRIVPCTPAAADYVRVHGGSPCARLSVGSRGVELSE